jgi:NAD(P)-dependent dehydrogenase (short-subunit alcohol dehydrogenase family)
MCLSECFYSYAAQSNAQECGQMGARVHAAAPGAADTEHHENLCRHDDRKAVSSDIMMKGKPKETRFVAEQKIKYVLWWATRYFKDTEQAIERGEDRLSLYTRGCNRATKMTQATRR